MRTATTKLRNRDDELLRTLVRELGKTEEEILAQGLRALYAVDLHIVPHPRNGLPQALPLRPRGPEYREVSPHDA